MLPCQVMESNLSFLSFSYLKGKLTSGGLKKYLSNLGWMFFARIGNMIIALIATAYIARSIGVQNYGQLSYATSFVSLFSFFAAFGIDQVLSRDLVRFPDKRNTYMGSAMALRIVTALIAILVSVTIAALIPSEDISLLLITIISLSFLFSSFLLITYEFQAISKSKYPSLLSIIIVIILNICKILIILSGKGVIYLALTILLEPILYMIGLLYLQNKYLGPISNWEIDINIIKSITRDAFPLIFSSAFIAIYARIDQVMIKNMLGNTEAGLYDAAVRLSELWYFIPHTITAGMFPAILNAKLVSDTLYAHRMKMLFYTLLFMSVVTAFFTSFFAKPIISIVFGAGFIGTISILQIYIWSNVGAAINLLVHQMLLAEELTYISSLTTFFGMITNVTLNLIFIPKYGMAGAAVASLISYTVPFASLYLFKKTRRLALQLFY